MEFLDKFVIPQSLEHIKLLHYLATLVLFLFVPFISIVFGSTALSLHFRKKGTSESDKGLICFAKDLIGMFTVNKNVGIVLGIIPVITLMLIYAQLLHSANNSAVTYLFIASILIIVSFIFIYTYRYLMSFDIIFNSLQNFESDNKTIVNDFNKLSKASRTISLRVGHYGLILLVLSIWFLLGGWNVALHPEQADKQGIFAVLFSLDVIIRLLSFLSFAMALTGGAILFRFFFWEGGIKGLDEKYLGLVKNIGVKIAFYFSALIPIFLVINLTIFPKAALSSSIFIYSGLTLFFLFICYNILYAMTKNEKVNYSGVLFILLLLAMCFSLTKDQLAMNNATELQTLKLGKKYEVMMASLTGETVKVPVINGEDVFQTRCSACHAFDYKIVGPSYNESLKKYEGKLKDLVAFILNPKKINPDYIPMPNPGLKPSEAKAVAKYILKTYKK